MKTDPQIKQQSESSSSGVAPKKHKRLKYIAVLPSFVTLLNGACGFFAILFASLDQELRWSFFSPRFSVSSFSLAAYMIIFAMLADMLDGRVARLTRTTSSFGGQLDSLADTISFGVAPAFLILKLVESQLLSIRIEDLWLYSYLRKGLLFSAVLYVMCAVVRLARFNVENEEDEAAHMNFTGLPTPAAAGVVISLVFLQQRFFAPHENSIFNTGIFIFLFIVITLVSGLLMVSRIRYPHLPNQLLRGKKTLFSLLGLFASVFLVIWNLQLAIVIGFCGFAFFGLVRWVFVKIFRKLKPHSNPK